MLTFGTAGLRGPVQEGPDGMNVTTVTLATAGLAAWLTAGGHGGGTVVVGRDARYGSTEFASATAEVFAAAGFDVVVLPEPGPTPLVAFATRRLAAVAGVMITASHNPPADNGYKVYLDPGAQLIGPADREIENAIAEFDPATVSEIPRTKVVADKRALTVRSEYLARLAEHLPPVSDSAVSIALTAMHGVGGALALDALAQAGFTDVHPVAEQFEPDPDFPTVTFPNPEEPGATDLLLAAAERLDASMAIALDPDADRCAIGARWPGGWRMLTGDETGALLVGWVLDRFVDQSPAPIVASSIVSGTLMGTIATDRGAEARRTLTGFKWLVRAGEPLVYAYEEALGHCVDPSAVRDKDGISAAVACAMIAHEWSDKGGVAAALDDIMARYGVVVTTQKSVRCACDEERASIMRRLRTGGNLRVGGYELILADYANRSDALHTDCVELVDADRTIRVVVRPSGTEPKIKFYGEMRGSAGSADTVETTRGAVTTALTSILDVVVAESRTAGTTP